MNLPFFVIESHALDRRTPEKVHIVMFQSINQCCNDFLPCQHSREFLRKFQHMELRPIAVPSLDTPITELYAFHSSRICCRLRGMVCSRHSSHAKFVH